jgi:hypothetical protein
VNEVEGVIRRIEAVLVIIDDAATETGGNYFSRQMPIRNVDLPEPELPISGRRPGGHAGQTCGTDVCGSDAQPYRRPARGRKGLVRRLARSADRRDAPGSVVASTL